MKEDQRFTNTGTLLTRVFDPNPSESATHELIISSETFKEYDGDAILAELCMLYDQKLDFGLACQMMDELAKHDVSTVYVGSADKCRKWSGIFLGLGLKVRFNPV